MSQVRGYPASGNFYSNLVKPVKIDTQFTVTPTNGLGITSLKSNGYVNNVFMHTSTTPTANNGYTNPNPANGYALIQMKNNYNAYIGGYASIQPPVTGSAILIASSSVLTVGAPYIITTVGTSTAANWQAVGLPPGFTPTVGQSFIATVTGGGTGTGAVKAVGTSSVIGFEVIGNPNLLIASSSIEQYAGGFVLLRFLGQSFTGESYTPAGTNSAPTFTGESYTPAGTISAGNIPVAAGTAGDAVTNNAGVLNSTGGQDLTVDAQTFTGTAHTLAGTVSAPTFTGTAHTLAGTITEPATAPTTSSIISLSLFYDASSVTIDGL